MTDATTRRGFLRTAATIGGCCVASGWGFAGPSREPDADSDGNVATARNAPVIVVTQSVPKDVNPRSASWEYMTEVLRRAGVFFDRLSTEQLPSLRDRPNAIVLLAGNLSLTAQQREALAAWVQAGGSLIGIGGTSGLDELFGVSNPRRLAESWIEVTAADHPLTAGLRSSLHVFGGYAVTPGSATPLAELNSGRVKGCAISEHCVGTGRAILLAPDLLFSIVHIQQGLPVYQDCRPAPDGSAETNEGILKAEDGMVLDWQRDRTVMTPDDVPVFLEPISDELRELILRSVFHAASEKKVRLPVLWYWPRDLPAVGHISHDTDGNDPKRAEVLLDVMNRCSVKSTWLILYPGGYPKEFYTALKEQGFEVGLHYDALGGGAETSWAKDDFLLQHQWLLEEAGIQEITSNKNHYTRWESRLDFWRWCEDVGIRSDQTRGPSKQGTIGFPLGGSQPYFPLDDEVDPPRFLDVLEINLQTQDLAVVCPAQYGRQLVDSVLRHHGVAHFLFHPAHIIKPPVAEALGELVDYGRARGMEWWTSRQIYQWEVLRRSVTADFDSGGNVTLRAQKPVQEATLLFLKSDEPYAVRIAGQSVPIRPQSLYGFDFEAITLDIAGEVGVTQLP